MRIELFNPFAYLLIVAMVFYALKPGVERMIEWREVLDEVAESGLVIDGDRLQGLIVTEHATLEYRGDGAIEQVSIGSVGLFAPESNFGAHYLVSVDAVRRLRGVEVDILYEVRSAAERGSMEWQARVVIVGAADTGWLPQAALPDWSVVTVRMTIPDVDLEWPLDLMIWSDSRGGGGGVDLRRLEVRPVDPDAAEPVAPPVSDGAE
jgi:hypothetical protein